VKSDAERIGELEVEVQILDNRIGALEFGHQALQSNLRALRSELEQNRTIGTPVRSTTLRTIDAVPLAIRRVTALAATAIIRSQVPTPDVR